jgi:hypothetical protein
LARFLVFTIITVPPTTSTLFRAAGVLWWAPLFGAAIILVGNAVAVAIRTAIDWSGFARALILFIWEACFGEAIAVIVWAAVEFS